MTQDLQRDYLSELDIAIEVFNGYPEGYEKKYYASLVCEAAIRFRDSQK